MSEPIISVSGLRGIIGESLDPFLAIRYSCAFAQSLSEEGPIVVTRDGRTTGTMLAQAICSGLMAIGRDVIYGNIAATPTTGILVRQHAAAGGIQISASHNPSPYNGLKLFGAHGRVVDAVTGEGVLNAYRNFEMKTVKHDQIGVLTNLDDTTSAHLEKVLATVDVERIAAKNYSVALDSHHGSGSLLGIPLLEALNCRVAALGGAPDGQFEHPPEPTQENLKDTAAKAVDFGADATFCQDPDADRMAIIDEKGNYIGEEYTLAITLDHRLSQQSGNVVINCSSSRMSNDICDAHDSDIRLSAVGEANVTSLMIERDAVYGGEGNGGPIDPRVGYVRDSFVAMAQTLDAMAASDRTISELVAALPRYEICKTKVSIEREKIPGLFEQLKARFSEATVSEVDGLRLDWGDRWMLVRPSNTEPIVRAFAESKSAQQAQELCDAAAEIAATL